MNKNNLTPFEKDLLKSMNKKAMLILKAEEFLKEAKITFNTVLFDQMSEEEMESFVETWNPVKQETLRKKYVRLETESDN
tara:strand:- start:1384 stop:1623 length:240 start_codon:yes stop_codon:yes gene_type:complete